MSEGDSSIRVLHVEDDTEYRSLVVEMLDRIDDSIQVRGEPDPETALESIADGGFDCVLSDYVLSGMDGIELLERVRATHPDLPVIIYTGKGSEAVASDAIRAGATDYLQKGSDSEEFQLLANRIRNAVEQSRSARRADRYERAQSLTAAVDQALIRAASMEDAETRVCEAICSVAPYRLAWIGRPDPESGTVVPRATGGNVTTPLESLAIPFEAADAENPIAEALRSGRLRIGEGDDEAFAGLSAAVQETALQSMAAIPLDHGERRYGVLVVYADAGRPFDDDERSLLADIGRDVAMGLHSTAIESELRTERDRRRALFENAPTPVLESRIADERPDHLIADVNAAFESVFGVDRDSVVGEPGTAVHVPGDEADGHVELRERTESGETVTMELERETTDGRRDFLVHAIPYGEDGSAEGFYVWYTDVTERNERLRDLRSFREAVENTDYAVFWTDTDGTIEYVNSAFEEQTGYSAAEAIGATPSILASGEHDESLYESMWGTITDGETWQGQLVNEAKGGRQYIVDQTISPVADENGDLRRYVAINTEVTDRVRRKRELEETNTVLRTIVETLPMGVLVEDAERNVLMANDRLCEVLGVPVSADDMVGRDCQAAAEEIKDRFADPQDFVESIEDHVETREPVRNEELELGDGRILERDYVPYSLPDGEASLWLYRDVTERRRYEARLERQNERLDRFASVVSHDLRNPLNVAQGRLELAMAECDSEHLKPVAASVERSISLIERLLELSRKGEPASDRSDLSLQDVVRSCWETVRTESATIEVETDRTVAADRSRLQQLFENLFRNAVEHAGPDVTVTVGPLSDGFYVADDGPGIPEEVRERAFDAGFTTEENGTGFGLSIVREIANAHGWGVAVTTSEAAGARFEFTGIEEKTA
jgi:PAS domain S-box-containing protein